MHVVTANKGPIILAYRELHDLAAENGVQLRFDGAVAGGLPVLYLAQRDLRGARILRIEAVPNLVTGYVMDLVGEGFSWNQALVRASREGVLEADARWDLDGWDAAAKLVILVNAIAEEAALRERPARMEDVTRTGILDLDPDALRRAREEGQRYRLLAQAERRGGGDFLLSVGPEPLGPEHPLGRLGSKQMGVVLNTDIYGTIVATIDEQDPVPSAASMLRDLLDIMV
jgi:homoserine dehydrogenase